MSVASTLASTFVLVFVAEWGDKSFFSTIGIVLTTIPYKCEILFSQPTLTLVPCSFTALAAASSPPGVIAGSLAGHGVATLVRNSSTYKIHTKMVLICINILVITYL